MVHGPGPAQEVLDRVSQNVLDLRYEFRLESDQLTMHYEVPRVVECCHFLSNPFPGLVVFGKQPGDPQGELVTVLTEFPRLEEQRLKPNHEIYELVFEAQPLVREIETSYCDAHRSLLSQVYLAETIPKLLERLHIASGEGVFWSPETLVLPSTPSSSENTGGVSNRNRFHNVEPERPRLEKPQGCYQFSEEFLVRRCLKVFNFQLSE